MPAPIEELKLAASVLPETPGVYQYFDDAGEIIYVGKAKNLKRRVSSYFNKTHDSGKVRVMVRKIARMAHIVVDTEMDALLLENNLIKKHKPRYNILLRDDKTYPWICVTREEFPRVFLTRDRASAPGELFGPFTSGFMVKSLVDFARRAYRVRACRLALNRRGVAAGDYEACLEHQIGNCLAPCVGLQSHADYNASVDQVRQLLRGDIREAIDHFRGQMTRLAAEYRFEEAEQAKNTLQRLENYQSRSMIVGNARHDIDVFSIEGGEQPDVATGDNLVYVNYLKVTRGLVTQSYTIEIQRQLDEPLAEILATAIVEIRERLGSRSPEIVASLEPAFPVAGAAVTVPQRGDKRRLLELSAKNARDYRLDRLKRADKLNPAARGDRLMATMRAELRLPREPRHIECFDNSNLQGTNPVASCVVFRDGRPSKREYRKFHIRTVVGADDFASMREVVTRRYARLEAEGQPLPDLVVVDGGKGQLGMALEALEALGLRDRICLISIAKRLEEIFVPGDPVPLYIDKSSPTLKVIQHIRNESHRFGITFHRGVRSKGFIASELDGAKGIGPKTKSALLKEFGTVAAIKAQPQDELARVVGPAKAAAVAAFFAANDAPPAE